MPVRFFQPLLWLWLCLSFSCAFWAEFWEPQDVLQAIYNQQDQILPVVSIHSPQPGEEVGLHYRFSGFALDDSSGVEAVWFSLDSSPFKRIPVLQGQWSTNLTLSVFGPLQIRVFALDRAGNTSLTQTVSFIRSSVPWILLAEPSALLFYTNVSSLRISGTAGVESPYHITNLQYSHNGGTWLSAAGTNQWEISHLTLFSGSNSFHIRALSDSGKEKILFNLLIIYDDVPPGLNILSPSNYQVLFSSNTAFSGNVFDNFSLEGIYLSINNGAYLREPAQASWSTEQSLRNGYDHTNMIRIFAKDMAGNTSLTQQLKIRVWNILYSRYNPEAEQNLGSSLDSTADGLFLVSSSTLFENYTGRVSCFQWTNSTWTETALTNPLGVTNTLFGRSVSISGAGNSLLAGTTRSFSAFLYSPDTSGWEDLPEMLKNPADKTYGQSVASAFSDTTYAVGAEKIVYLYRWNGFVWETAELTNADYSLGSAISLSSNGNLLAAGDPVAQKAFTFRRQSGSWQCTLLPVSSPGAGSLLGKTVCLSPDGNTLAVGVEGYQEKRGAVYLLRWNGFLWSATLLTAADGQAQDLFGSSLSLSHNGNVLAIGAPGKDNGRGAVYLFRWESLQWSQEQLAVLESQPALALGSSLSLSADGKLLFAGAPGYLFKEKPSGAVFVYSLE